MLPAVGGVHLVNHFRVLVRNVAHFGSIFNKHAVHVNQVQQAKATSVGDGFVTLLGEILSLELASPGWSKFWALTLASGDLLAFSHAKSKLILLFSL